ncbi:MAG TPA: UDP-N-acetylmuramate--L-alanine ligase [Candidatus Paceibacterota bacterium]|nr:UDP-N-acetylmuramate--L-alanine ligase [Candidatus Pacearchaeota archaeon]HRZ51273.1 UDP-N-acetylmuramate--L-alanine ligase [Candidatus Paceibacterota bacterium]HSA36995.1 UDP-N-acetylmuramate--L-alanine ligase [Candidatus Paceibacterota bacterium]
MRNRKKIYFIGLGGIGVSALARYYLSEGWDVFGSDIAKSEITDSLKTAGAFFYENAQDLKKLKPALLVYSPAVPADNPELIQARGMGIECLSYPEALGRITKNYFTIAVCGTHGKSTTTAMLALAMAEAGLDPTVVVGTKIKEFGDTNFRRGRSEYLVIEACEHLGSFLNYWPKIIVVTNIEADHLDYYKNEGNYRRAFLEFAKHLDGGGILAVNADDKNAAALIKQSRKNDYKIIEYGSSLPEFEQLKTVLQVPGIHNVYNALAAVSAARMLGVKTEDAIKAVSKFKGAWRRFQINEIMIKGENVTLVSDYGHHPTEVSATISAARLKWPRRFITVVFQPHQYQRTLSLFSDFANVLNAAPADRIVVTDIYGVAGREEAGTAKVSSKSLVEAAKKKSVIYIGRSVLAEWIAGNVKAGEVLVIMGAGDIYGLSESLFGSVKKNV